ncbi:hypothetical protein BQ8482_80153 [Mesorhizobium delmotii]|uniref:Uncharacterized protein n=1 Tax=Mesorhizobium delmotii TaxID=1631247 RepID=A0A2P9AWM7_9HYPH|nr:hypothetical protein BQ8482_80153 [Mesorhizobium delmotii]
MIQVARLPTTMPMARARNRKMKSGSVTVSAGLPGLNGSRVKATGSRLATASAIRMTASGTKTTTSMKRLNMEFPVEGGLYRGPGPTEKAGMLHELARRLFAAVQPFTQFLAGLEERHPFLLDLDGFAGARVAAGAGGAVFHRESTETAQLDPVAFGKRVGDLVENRADDVFDVAQKKVRVACGDDLHKFGFDHEKAPRENTAVKIMRMILFAFFTRLKGARRKRDRQETSGRHQVRE